MTRDSVAKCQMPVDRNRKFDAQKVDAAGRLKISEDRSPEG